MAAGDDDAELRRHHIKPLRHVLADQHLLLAGMLRQLLRLDHHFDPLQMRCEALAWPRRTFAFRTLAALVDLCPDRGDAGFNFLEDKGLLLVVGGWGAELFRSPAEAGAIECFQDLRQPLDALIGIGVARLEIGDLVLQRVRPRRLLGMASTMAFSASTSSGSLRSGGVIGSTKAHFAPVFLPFQAADSLRRRAFTRQSPAA